MFERETQRRSGYVLSLGIAPLLWFAGEIILGARMWNVHPLHALLSYGATFLAFVGGIYWMHGVTMRDQSRVSQMVIAMSLVPLMTGAGALCYHGSIGLMLLLAGYIALLGCEWHFYRHEIIPAWLWTVRWRISVVVIAVILAVLVVIRT
ncbi:MAG: DUF3429 family protein [Alphaproteobacteria bacterium]|nr:MAG: DUF3429 family protein [Alphaproteobacteria bacterium]